MTLPAESVSCHGTRIHSWCPSAAAVNANAHPTCSRNSDINAVRAAWPRTGLSEYGSE